jgi:hypothetical protein
MGNYRVGSKVRVPRLNWNRAEITEVRPFWKGLAGNGKSPLDLEPDDFKGHEYLVKNLENDQMAWLTSDDLMLVA